MKKKILVVGNSICAIAFAKKMSEEHEVYVAPSSCSFPEAVIGVDIREGNVRELLDFVMENGIDMTIAVSEEAIKNNISSIFADNNQSIFAPTSEAAIITTDKAKAKKMLYKLRIPTPKFGIFDKQNMVNDYLKNQKTPFVIKTNERNSATILTSILSAKNIVDSVFIDKNNKIIIEDYIYGTPFSFYAITDGYKALPIASAITYRHTLEGNGGQLTDGMGACSPNYKLSVEQECNLMDNVIYPTLEQLDKEQTPYMGIIGVNGIMSENGRVSVLGWHSFFQDCDAPSILRVLDENLYDLFESCIVGSFSDEVRTIKEKNVYAVSLVIKNNNKNNKENIITGLDNLDEDSSIEFYPGINRNKYLEYEAGCGNVAVLTAEASSVSKASKKVYNEVECINFKGMSYRKDICIACK